MKPKVLMLLQFFEPGGLEWMAIHAAEFLQQDGGAEPLFFVYDRSGSSEYPVQPLDARLQKAQIPLERWQKPPGFSWKLISILSHKVRREKIGVIHVHQIGSLMYAVLAKILLRCRRPWDAPLKIVYTQHSFVHVARYPRTLLWEKLFVPWADTVTAVSEPVAQEFATLQIRARSRVELISNGTVFPEMGMTDLLQQEQLRQRLAPTIDTSDLWVLYLARQHRGKGQDHAMQIWQNLPAEIRKKSRLIFQGPPVDPEFANQLSETRSKLPDADRVVILPGTEDVRSWLQASDAFWSASDSEGWPLAPMEALGAGTPAWLSDISGHRMYGSWAKLVPPGHGPDAVMFLAAEIGKLLQTRSDGTLFQKERQAQWLGTSDLRAEFSIAQMAKKYLSIYNN